jgi:hypothetical protein
VFTVGGVLVLTWWWLRVNALGEQFRGYAAITDESRAIAEDLTDRYRDHFALRKTLQRRPFRTRHGE